MMVLEALRVRHWRGLDDAALEGLAPDLNLVVGPNESGKSRLFEALHHALFERYKGASQEKLALRSWHSDEPPEVEVVFVAGGHRYTLHKRFLDKEGARLEGAGHTWRDDEAEARVRALLGTRDFARVLKEEHMGIWPLVWLPQGASGAAPHEHLTEDGRGRIRDVLATEIDQVAAGPAGQHVLERVARELDRYWSKSRKLPTGELRAAREAVAATEEVLADALARREASRALGEDLLATEQHLAGLAPRVAALQEAAAKTDERAKAAVEARRAIEVHEARAAERKGAAERAEDELAERARRAAEIADLEGRLAEAVATGEQAAARLADLGGRLGAAASAVRAAEAAEAETQRLLDLATRDQKRRELTRVAERKRTAFDGAATVAAELAESEEALRRHTLDPMRVQTLRALAEAHRLADARVEAAAVAVALRAERDLVVDGTPLPAGETRLLRVQDTRAIEVDGLVVVTVSPGEGALARLRDAAHDARRQLERGLREAAVSDVAEAEEQLEVRNRAADRVKTLAERLRARAPDGVDALRAEALQAEAALARLAEAEGGEEASTLALPLPLADREAVTLDRDAAETARQAARATLDQARDAHYALAEQTAGAREAASVARVTVQGLRDDLARRRARLAEQPPEAQLVQARDDARRHLLDAERRLEALRQEHRAAGGDDAEVDADRARRALQAAQSERAERVGAARDLRAKLEVHGGERLHEDVLEAEAALDVARGAAGRVERRALAARRLAEALSAARQQAQERLLAPVRARVEPYLRDLFPGSSLDLDEEWRVLGLRTSDTPEPFDQLSGGAREQLSVIVRLGLAEVLARGGTLPVVLDDALVNTDPARLERMLRVLFRAARGLQVLVFSCHEVAFDGLGATRVYRLPAPAGPRFRPTPAPPAAPV